MVPDEDQQEMQQPVTEPPADAVGGPDQDDEKDAKEILGGDPEMVDEAPKEEPEEPEDGDTEGGDEAETAPGAVEHRDPPHSDASEGMSG